MLDAGCWMRNAERETPNLKPGDMGDKDAVTNFEKFCRKK
jgi:hypothetical protein